MDQKWKQKWVKALRSGKYKQGREKLKSFDSKKQPRYCCLGVLGEIQGQKIRKHTEYLPKKWAAGLSRTTQSQLSRMNDGVKYDIPYMEALASPRRSFKYIANWIEKNL